jgi:hypothetical protein
MKATIKKDEIKKEFTPFNIEFTIQTVSEARLFFHLCNHSELMDLIIKDKDYKFNSLHNKKYNPEVAPNIVCSNMNSIIEDELNRQGFSVIEKESEIIKSGYKLYQRLLILIQKMKSDYINDSKYHTEEDEKAIMQWSDEEAKEVYNELYNNIFNRFAKDYKASSCCFCIKNRNNNTGCIQCENCDYAKNRNNIYCTEDCSYYSMYIGSRRISNETLQLFVNQVKSKLDVGELSTD